jgi:UDP-3-O-[3-hydroxymyristoyl] glucosamine N-acyltransferase
MKTLQAIAEAIGAIPVLARPVSIVRVASFRDAGPDALVFVEHSSSLAAAIASGAGAVIAPLETNTNGTPMLLCKHPRLAFARAARLLQPPRQSTGIHPASVIEHPELLGAELSIGAFTSVGEARIGSGTSIGACCSIADGVAIGRDCAIYSNVTLYSGTTLGDRVVVHAGAVLGADGFGYVRDPATGQYLQFPQQGTLTIEDDVEIGANSTIDRGALEETRIGRGTKLDNLVHIGHNVRVGRNVVIASQTGVSGSCTIGDGAVLGGQVGMGDHATVGDGVIVGGGTGILPHKKLSGAGRIFWGTPAKPLKQYLKELAMLSRLTRRSGEAQ